MRRYLRAMAPILLVVAALLVLNPLVHAQEPTPDPSVIPTDGPTDPVIIDPTDPVIIDPTDPVIIDATNVANTTTDPTLIATEPPTLPTTDLTNTTADPTGTNYTAMAGVDDEPVAIASPAIDLNQVFGTGDAAYNQDDSNAPVVAPVVLPPNITMFTCSVDTVDVTTNDATITCTTAAFSLQSQVSFISAAFYNPDKTKRIPILFTPVNLADGSSAQGTYSTQVTIPMGMDEAVWTLGYSDTAFEALSVGDVEGRVQVYSSEAVKLFTTLSPTLKIVSYNGPPLAYPQSQILTSTGLTITGIVCDSDGQTLRVTPTTFSKTITCSIMVLMDGAGLGYVDTFFVSQTGNTVFNMQFAPTQDTAFYQHGVKVYAQMNSTITIPFWAESGLYSMPLTGAYQAITKSRASTLHPINTKEISTPPAFQLITTGQDTKPPSISSFYCSPTGTVKISPSSPTKVICNVRAAEDISGINYIGMQFVSPSKDQFMDFAYVPPSQGLGDFKANPILTLKAQQSVELPGGAEPGVWALVRAVAADNAGNYYAYRASDFDATQVKNYFVVENTVVGFGFTPKDAGAVVVDPDHPQGQQVKSSAATMTSSFLVMVLSSLLMARLAWRQ